MSNSVQFLSKFIHATSKNIVPAAFFKIIPLTAINWHIKPRGKTNHASYC